MANKGKGPMHPDILARELEEKEQRRRVADNLRQWWEMQREIDFDLPVPEECLAPNVAPVTSLGAATVPPTPISIVGPSQDVVSSRPLPQGPKDIPQLSPPVAVDRFHSADLQGIWDWIPAPKDLSQSPWYRLENGYIRFIYGESWEYIDREERAYARRREAARACGIPVLEEPPPQRPGEVILRLKEENFLDPPPVVEEEEESDDEDDDIEDNEDDEFWVEVERRNIPDEEDNLSMGSDASVITEEITEVPLSRRNLP